MEMQLIQERIAVAAMGIVRHHLRARSRWDSESERRGQNGESRALIISRPDPFVRRSLRKVREALQRPGGQRRSVTQPTRPGEEHSGGSERAGRLALFYSCIRDNESCCLLTCAWKRVYFIVAYTAETTIEKRAGADPGVAPPAERRGVDH